VVAPRALNADGSAIDSLRVGAIEVLTTTNVPSIDGVWEKIAGALVLSEGVLRLEVGHSFQRSQRGPEYEKTSLWNLGEAAVRHFVDDVVSWSTEIFDVRRFSAEVRCQCCS
jgi:hypothetical protein